MAQQILLIIAALGLVLLNGFFVAVEFAIVKVRGTRIEELAATGHWRARTTRHVLHRLDAYLSACQLGITLASLALGWIGKPAFANIIEPLLVKIGVTSPTAIHSIALITAFAIISFLHIVLGELAPKSMAIRKPEETSLWLALPLRVFHFFMYPAIVVLNGTANALLRVVGLTHADEGSLAHSPEELRMIVTASHAHGVLNATETRLLENVFGLSERPVAEIMTPRVEMICLDRSRSFDENLQTVRTHQHTRYPLIDGSPDQVLGIIHVKDLIRIAGEPQVASLDALMRPVHFIPESASIDHLLKLIQKTRTLMAVVVEEYGGVAGVVTLEDILEELIGEIRDEFDSAEQADVVRRGETVHLSPGIPIADALQALPGLKVELDEDIRTLGGHIMKRLGRVPKVGDIIEFGPWRAKITRMDGQRVTRLAMSPVEASSQ